MKPKKIFKFIIVFIIVYYNALSQEKNTIDLEFSKIFPNTRIFQENTIFSNYKGLFDFGVSYNYKIRNNFYSGVSLNSGFLFLKSSLSNDEYYKTNSLYITSLLNFQYLIKINKKIQLIPKVGIGYSLVNIQNKEYNYSTNQYGISSNYEIKLNYLTDKRIDFNVFLKYSYIYLKKDVNFTKLNYYRNVYFFDIGFGIKYKIYKNDEKNS